MSSERLIYTRRPDGTALWLTEAVATAIGAPENSDLTPEQFNHPKVTALLTKRTTKKPKDE